MSEKKTESVDLSKEQDREKLKKALEKAEAVYGSQQKQESEDVSELEQENIDLKEKLAIIAEYELDKRMNKLGITNEADRAEFRQNPSMLKGFEKALENQGSAHVRQIAEGSAPLNSAQMYGSQNQQGYGSVQEMLDDLYAREKQGDKEASKIIGKLVLKMARGTLKGQQTDSFERPQLDLETEKGIVSREISPLTTEDESESELLKLGVRKKTPRAKMKKVDKDGNPK